MGASKPFIKGGFFIPIFGLISSPHAAFGDVVVRSFHLANLSGDSIVPVEPGQSAEVKAGDLMPCGFEARDGRVFFGDFSATCDFVRKEISSFDDMPFSQTEMAQFINDPEVWKVANGRRAALLDECRAGAGAEHLRNSAFRPFNPAAHASA